MENKNTPATIQDALSAILAAVGLDAMARDVRTENDADRLARYAKICLRQSPEAKRPALCGLLRSAGLIL